MLLLQCLPVDSTRDHWLMNSLGWHGWCHVTIYNLSLSLSLSSSSCLSLSLSLSFCWSGIVSQGSLTGELTQPATGSGYNLLFANPSKLLSMICKSYYPTSTTYFYPTYFYPTTSTLLLYPTTLPFYTTLLTTSLSIQSYCQLFSQHHLKLLSIIFLLNDHSHPNLFKSLFLIWKHLPWKETPHDYLCLIIIPIIYVSNLPNSETLSFHYLSTLRKQLRQQIKLTLKYEDFLSGPQYSCYGRGGPTSTFPTITFSANLDEDILCCWCVCT